MLCCKIDSLTRHKTYFIKYSSLSCYCTNFKGIDWLNLIWLPLWKNAILLSMKLSSIVRGKFMPYDYSKIIVCYSEICELQQKNKLKYRGLIKSMNLHQCLVDLMNPRCHKMHCVKFVFTFIALRSTILKLK